MKWLRLDKRTANDESPNDGDTPPPCETETTELPDESLTQVAGGRGGDHKPPK